MSILSRTGNLCCFKLFRTHVNLFYQFIYALVAYYLVKQFYIGVEHADTRHIIPALAIMAFVPCTALLYTSYRFMKGER